MNLMLKLSASMIGVSLFMVGCGSSSPSSASSSQPSSSPSSKTTTQTQSPSKQGGGSSKTVTITDGIVSKTAVDWPTFIAVDKGFMKKNGLNVKLTVTGGVSGTVQQLLAGSLDFGESTIEAFIRSENAGANVKMIAGSALKFPYSLVANPKIKSLADLKGKKIMVAAIKDPSYFFTEKILASHGVPAKQWIPVSAGSTPDRYAALISGAASAAILTQPFDFQAEGKGYHKLADLTPLASQYGYGFTAIGTTQAMITKHPGTVRKFVHAYGEALNWLMNPANKSEAIAILEKHANLPKKYLDKTYNLYINQLKEFSLSAKLPAHYVQGTEKEIIQTGGMKSIQPVSKFANTSFIP